MKGRLLLANAAVRSMDVEGIIPQIAALSLSYRLLPRRTHVKYAHGWRVGELYVSQMANMFISPVSPPPCYLRTMPRSRVERRD